MLKQKQNKRNASVPNDPSNPNHTLGRRWFPLQGLLTKGGEKENFLPDWRVDPVLLFFFCLLRLTQNRKPRESPPGNDKTLRRKLSAAAAGLEEGKS